MEIPPERSMTERAKTRRGDGHAAPRIEHDEALQQSAHLEDDFPFVLLPEIAGLDIMGWR